MWVYFQGLWGLHQLMFHHYIYTSLDELFICILWSLNKKQLLKWLKYQVILFYSDNFEVYKFKIMHIFLMINFSIRAIKFVDFIGVILSIVVF